MWGEKIQGLRILQGILVLNFPAMDHFLTASSTFFMLRV